MTEDHSAGIGKVVLVRPRELPKDLRECHLEILKQRDEIIGLSAELAELRARLENSSGGNLAAMESSAGYWEVQARLFQNEVQMVRASWTWRVGRLMMFPVRLVKRLLGRPI